MLSQVQNQALQGKEVSDILIISMKAVMMWFWWHNFSRRLLSTVLVFLICGCYELLHVYWVTQHHLFFTTRRCHAGPVKTVNMLDT